MSTTMSSMSTGMSTTTTMLTPMPPATLRGSRTATATCTLGCGTATVTCRTATIGTSTESGRPQAS
jgi:hypothetical protein